MRASWHTRGTPLYYITPVQCAHSNVEVDAPARVADSSLQSQGSEVSQQGPRTWDSAPTISRRECDGLEFLQSSRRSLMSTSDEEDTEMNTRRS